VALTRLQKVLQNTQKVQSTAVNIRSVNLFKLVGGGTATSCKDRVSPSSRMSGVEQESSVSTVQQSVSRQSGRQRHRPNQQRRRKHKRRKQESDEQPAHRLSLSDSWCVGLLFVLRECGLPVAVRVEILEFVFDIVPLTRTENRYVRTVWDDKSGWASVLAGSYFGTKASLHERGVSGVSTSVGWSCHTAASQPAFTFMEVFEDGQWLYTRYRSVLARAGLSSRRVIGVLKCLAPIMRDCTGGRNTAVTADWCFAMGIRYLAVPQPVACFDCFCRSCRNDMKKGQARASMAPYAPVEASQNIRSCCYYCYCYC
jgi:hypothetical protein